MIRANGHDHGGSQLPKEPLLSAKSSSNRSAYSILCVSRTVVLDIVCFECSVDSYISCKG